MENIIIDYIFRSHFISSLIPLFKKPKKINKNLTSTTLRFGHINQFLNEMCGHRWVTFVFEKCFSDPNVSLPKKPLRIATALNKMNETIMNKIYRQTWYKSTTEFVKMPWLSNASGSARAWSKNIFAFRHFRD